MKRLSFLILSLVIILSLPSCEENIEPTVPVTGIILNTESLALTEGEDFQLSATINPTNATNTIIVWSSSNIEIVKVDKNGMVTAIKEGKAYISASIGDISATCEITVSKDIGYLTFISEGETVLSLQNNGKNNPVLFYSTDAINWAQWDHINSNLTFTKDNPLYIYGDNPDGFNHSGGKYSYFRAAGDEFGIYGNIMSLIGKGNANQIPCKICFYRLFYDCSKLTTAPELPATKLLENCYNAMFQDCKGLKSAPTLPATTLADGCYDSMFWGCTSLTTAPELPATELGAFCYEAMFQGCSSLTTAPELPATKLQKGCYQQMFRGCKSLTKAPELLAKILEENCYNMMFQNCISLQYVKCMATNFAKNSIVSFLDGASPTGTLVHEKGCRWDISTAWSTANAVPFGWTRQFHGEVNNYMTFTSEGKTNLSLDPYRGTSLIYYSTNKIDWIQLNSGVKGTNEYYGFVKTITINSDSPVYICGLNTSLRPPGVGSPNKDSHLFVSTGDRFSVSGNVMSLLSYNELLEEIPSSRYCFAQSFADCTNLTTAPELPATTLAEGCYSGMFSGCTSLTSAPELPATTLAEGCYSGMFSGCTSLTSAPELPATTLAEGCYSGMFSGCTSLTSAPELPAPVLVRNCYQQMFYGCNHLNYIKCLAINVEAEYSLYEWIYGVYKTGTFVKAAAMDWSNVEWGIPYGWTVVDAE